MLIPDPIQATILLTFRGMKGTVTPGVRTYHTLKRSHINDNEIYEIRKINYQIGPTSV